MGHISDTVAKSIQEALAALPDGFLDSFDFTTTGNNLCHPLTHWILAKCISELDEVLHVGIDVRLNDNGLRFQPDVVGFREDLSHVVYADFESPNSSDARIPIKDVRAYREWGSKVGGSSAHGVAPYFIVTSLPDGARPKWQLRHTGWNQYNVGHRGRQEQLRANPLRYWQRAWASALDGKDLANIFFLNVNGKKVSRIHPLVQT